MQLRAEVCARSNSRNPVELVVFDGDPADGNVISWNRIYIPNKNKCEAAWFNWLPTKGLHNLTATILRNQASPTLPNGSRLKTTWPLKQAILEVTVP